MKNSNPPIPIKGYWNRGDSIVPQHGSNGVYIFREKIVSGSPVSPPIILNSYWIAEYGELLLNQNDTFGASIAIDRSSNNTFLTGGTYHVDDHIANNAQAFLVRYNDSGNLISQYFISENILSNCQGDGIYIDATDNATIAITSQGPNPSLANSYVVKVDANANILWQNIILNPVNIFDMQGDSNNNTFVVGTPDNQGFYGSSVWISSFDLNGNIRWQQKFDYTDLDGGGVGAPSLAITNNNVYFTCFTGSQNLVGTYLSKIDSSTGAVTWDKIINDQQTAFELNSTFLDAQENIYNLGSGQDGYSSNSYVQKLDSNGNFIYQRVIHESAPGIQGPNRGLNAFSGTVDSNNNLYITGAAILPADNSFLSEQWVTMKLDQTGNIVWQNAIESTQTGMLQWYWWGHREISLSDDEQSLVLTGYCRQDTTSNIQYSATVALTTKIPANGAMIDLGANNWVMNATTYVASDTYMTVESVPVINSNPLIMRNTSTGIVVSQTGGENPYPYLVTSVANLDSYLYISSNA